MRTSIGRWALFTIGLALGCNSPAPSTTDAGVTDTAVTDAPVAPARAECNPLGYAEACMLPFPSAYYQTDTALALPMAALPISRGRLSNAGEPVALDPAPWNRLDGFSPSSPILAYLRGPLDVRTLIMRGKDRRMGRGYAKTQNWKKAIVTLRDGDTIAAFEPPTE